MFGRHKRPLDLLITLVCRLQLWHGGKLGSPGLQSGLCQHTYDSSGVSHQQVDGLKLLLLAGSSSMASTCITCMTVCAVCRVGFLTLSMVLLRYMGWVRRLHSRGCAGVKPGGTDSSGTP